jgi:hypothetical protein
MWSRIKQYLLIGAAGAGLYFLLSHHILIFSYQYWPTDVKLIKKSKLHLHDTFNSVNEVSPDRNRGVEVDALFKSKWLRQVGIGRRLVEWQVISEERRQELESKYR